MPRRRKVRRRRRRRRKSGLRLKSTISPIPDSYSTIMKYHDNQTINSGFTHLQQWRANSLYDSDLTGVGHQVMGFDQLKILYNRYRVDAVHYSVAITNRTSEQMLVCILPTNGATPSTYGEAVEQPRARWVILAPNGSGASTKTVSGWVSLKAVASASASMYKNDDRYQSVVSSNPAEAIELNVFATTCTGGTTLLFDMSTDLKYKCTFFDRIMLTQS